MSKTGATIQLVSRDASRNNSDSACFPEVGVLAPERSERDDVEEAAEESDS
jgi:hypothetical protein